MNGNRRARALDRLRRPVKGLTRRQLAALDVLRAQAPAGVDVEHLATALGTTREGAAQTAASLVRRGLAERWIGGVGRQRVHYSSPAS